MFEFAGFIISLVSSAGWVFSQLYEIKNLKTSNKEMRSELDILKEKRLKDYIHISTILNGFSVNLAKFDVTLNHVNETLLDVKDVLKIHSEELTKLK